MTLFINIIEKLKPYFTLRSEKEDVWSGYLCEDTKYVNGGVYVHSETPIYHKQKYGSDVWNGGGDSEVTCTLLVDGDNVVNNQLKIMEVLLDNQQINVRYSIIENGVTLTFNDEVDGLIQVSIPSLNERQHHYQGLIFKRRVKKQSLQLSGQFNRTETSLSFHLELTNPCNGQMIRCTTLYRNGTTNKKKDVILSNGQTNVNITMDKGTQDVGLRIELRPILKDEIMYMGKSISLYW